MLQAHKAWPGIPAATPCLVVRQLCLGTDCRASKREGADHCPPRLRHRIHDLVLSFYTHHRLFSPPLLSCKAQTALLNLKSYYLLLLPFPCRDWVLFLEGGHFLTCSHNQTKLSVQNIQKRDRRVKKKKEKEKNGKGRPELLQAPHRIRGFNTFTTSVIG